MNFEYNGNLTYEDRIEQVSKEIKNIYPDISNVDYIAALEPPITTKFDVDMLFRRLYNIILVNKEDYKIVNNVIHDMIVVLKTIKKDNEKYKNLIVSLIDYVNTSKNFPSFE